jgi:two-component system response regulator AlgR
MRVLLADDEALARLRLRSLLQELPGLAIQAIGEAANATEALALVRSAPATAPWDVLLLDVRMPGQVVPGRPSRQVGLRLAQALRGVPRPPLVVFVSAHAEYALAAFDLEAVDYLTKPVRRERLHAAMMRARQRLQQQGRLPGMPPLAWTVSAGTAAAPAPAGVAAGPSETAAAMVAAAGGAGLQTLAVTAAALGGGTGLSAPPVLVFSERGRLLRVPVAEVLYFKAGQKYVTLRTATHCYLLDEPLSALQTRLETPGGPAFVRVHRNALVALHAVRALELRDARELRAGHERRVGWPAREGTDGRDRPCTDFDDGSETWAVRVAPLDEWLAVSRRQVAAVRAALASGA